jgi:hypothetical protein
MKLKREQQVYSEPGRLIGWHILTVAEAGFSMLDIYGRRHHGLDIELIRKFADQVNEKDEAGSLHPLAPISAVPNRFFREQERSMTPEIVNDLKRCISEFLVANQTSIHAKRILIDFHVSPAAVPSRYVEAAEEVFRAFGEGSIDEVIIFT